MSDQLKFFKGDENHLPQSNVEKGALYHCVDTGNTYQGDSDNTYQIFSSAVGKKTLEYGEIFNDYENNKALSEYSTATGYQTIAGTLGFTINSIIDMPDSQLAIELCSKYDNYPIFGSQVKTDLVRISDYISDYINEDGSYKYSVSIHDPDRRLYWIDFGDVLSYSDETGQIFVSTERLKDKGRLIPADTTVSSSLYVLSFTLYPEKGIRPFATEAFATGNNTVATGISAHSEGYFSRAMCTATHAEGHTTIASGKHSHSEGYYSKALGAGSHAEGHNTIAEGDRSHAEGSGTYASGLASHAEGQNTIASAAGSHAEGSGTTASGTASLAVGRDTISSGSYSMSQGKGTVAFAEGSHTEGFETSTVQYSKDSDGNYLDANGNITTNSDEYVVSARGKYAHAEGRNVIASGEYSHAEGKDTKSSSHYSHAEGSKTETKGQYAHAEGSGTLAEGMCSHAEGYNTKTDSKATGSHAEGVSTTTYKAYSHTEGKNTKSYGESSHAEGYGCVTYDTAYYSHAEGMNTRVQGQYAHAEGNNTSAEGNGSHTEGLRTVAQGQYAHAEGNNTSAIGQYSHTEGTGTFATSENQHVQGKYNIGDFKRDKYGNLILDSDGTTIPGQTYAHIVGNGTSSTACSNAHTLDWDGNAWYAGTVSATGLILTEASYGESLPTTGVKGQIFFLKV